MCYLDVLFCFAPGVAVSSMCACAHGNLGWSNTVNMHLQVARMVLRWLGLSMCLLKLLLSKVEQATCK